MILVAHRSTLGVISTNALPVQESGIDVHGVASVLASKLASNEFR
jgi:hypothetical protein